MNNVSSTLWNCMVMAANSIDCTLSYSNGKYHVIGKGVNKHFFTHYECIAWMHHQNNTGTVKT